MAGYRPRKPPVSSPLFAFLAEVWDMLWGGKFPVIDTDTVKWSRGANGYAAHAAVPTAGGKGTTAKANFVGIYVPGTYNMLDQVLIQLPGPGAGEYVCLADGNTNAPTTGINWIQVSSLNQWF